VTPSNPTGKRALITGICGQDGSFLSEQLLAKGYQVFGLLRRHASPNLENIEHLLDRVTLMDADMTDQGSLIRAIKRCEPDEIYNLAAQSFVGVSFNQPLLTADVTGLGVYRLLEAVRIVEVAPRMYQASTSEMFGEVDRSPQDESTPFHPRSPYGCAKLLAYWAAVNYRKGYGIPISNGILFNHESERRGIEFVTRKISDAVARIKLGLQEKVALGTLDVKRDWGYSPEYTDLMWRILQHPTADDFVGATGSTHTIADFAREAFAAAGIADWQAHVALDERFTRPTDVVDLCGNPAKAKAVLHWEAKVQLKELASKMVANDLKRWSGAKTSPMQAPAPMA
jgi:GDPmannose 4,6-dehydratase